jgi:DNA-directed RNA polymerase specialized sigma24 family protein
VLQAWIYSGSVFAFLASRKMSVAPSEGELRELREDADARLALAGSTVAVALPKFKARALETGQWTVDGGASLTTYFMGATLYAFVNEFRRWRIERRKHLRQTPSAVTHDDPPGTHCLDPGTLVAATDAARRAYAEFGSDRIRDMVFLRTLGYTQEEIAETLSASSARAVEGVFHRLRKAERKRHRRRKEV